MNLLKEHYARVASIVVIAIITVTASYEISHRVAHANDTDAGKDISVFTNGIKQTMRLSNLPDVTFLTVPGQSPFTFKSGNDPGRFKLLVFLSAADCSGCLAALPEWNAVVAEHPDRLEGYLIFVNSSTSEITQAATAYNRSFTVLRDKDGEVAKRIGLPETPIAVLEDSSLVVRYAQGATNNSEARQSFLDAVKHIAIPD
jgi:peroxiredoxin